jgi:tetratricopeptide (TPR) repeat protein
LARTVADEQPSSPQALFWADHAGAWISRLGGASPKLEVYLEDARAAIHWGRGEFAEAERHDLRALELGEKAFGAEDVEVAKTLAGLALDFSGVGQLEKALQYARRAIAIKEKTLGPSHPSVGETLNNLAIDLIELGQLDEAMAAVTRADAIIRPVSPPSNPWLGSIQSNLAAIHELEGRLDDALRIRRAALAVQKEPYESAGLLTGIGSVLNRQGKFAEALAQHEKALAIEEKAYAGGDHPEMGEPLLGIGLARLGLSQPEKAIAPLSRAEAIANTRRHVRGAVRLALARALEATRRGDATRVRALMTAARGDLQSTPVLAAGELAQIDAWLVRHPR